MRLFTFQRTVFEKLNVVCFTESVSRPLGDLIIAPNQNGLKTPKNTNFSVNGGGKNHKVKPNFFKDQWVVFLDTDCKTKGPKFAPKIHPKSPPIQPPIYTPFHPSSPSKSTYNPFPSFPHPILPVKPTPLPTFPHLFHISTS